MSIFKYLEESLLAEKLPISTARKYVKKGRENVKTLPEEFIKAYDKMFGSKNRIQIGTIKIDDKDTTSMSTKDINTAVRDLNTFMRQHSNKDIPKEENLMFDVVLNSLDEEDPKYVNLQFSFSDQSIKKELAQAYDPKTHKYLFKTVIKRLKKYVDKDKHNELSQKAGLILTQTSNTIRVDEAPVVLSRHPYDVAGMSTAKRWQSCKDTVSGCNRHFLDDEVGHLLIAYVVNPKRKGKDLLNDPYARLLVLPVKGDDGYGLYVSVDIYKFGGEFKDFHSIVENYVEQFMVTYSSSDEKVAVGGYYPDAGFEDEDARQERLFNLIDRIVRRIQYSTSDFDEDMRDYIQTKMAEDDLNPEDVIPDVLIDEIDKLFRTLNNIDSDGSMVIDFYTDYMARDFDKFLEIIDQYTINDIIASYLESYYNSVDSGSIITRAVNLGIIPDVMEYMRTVISNDDISAMLDSPKFMSAFVEHIVDGFGDAVVPDGKEFFTDYFNLEKLWDSGVSRYVSVDDYYIFSRKMGLSDAEFLEVFDVSDFDDYNKTKAKYDQFLKTVSKE